MSSNFNTENVADLARFISSIERREPEAFQYLEDQFETIDRAPVLGVTGPPGVGKSTLVNRLIKQARDDGLRVAVVAVDPSSPFSGGALLGDRVRMQDHSADTGVFIRSMSTKGHLGGLNSSIYDVVMALSMAEFDLVILETVGVGQGEVEVARCSDQTALVLVPAYGDAVQLIKAGIQEITNCFIINKTDRFEPDQLINDLRRLVDDPDTLEIFPLSAQTGEGVNTCYESLLEFVREQNSDESHRKEIRSNHLESLLRERIENQVHEQLQGIESEVVNPYLETHTILGPDSDNV
ncbi:MAG: ArgK/MeaB family GTPase [bacterium]